MLVLFGVLAALTAVALALIGVGQSLPVRHTVARCVPVPAAPAAVWARITDHVREPEWRAHLERVERSADVDGRPAWREVSGREQLTLVTVRADPPRTLVRRIGPGLPFGGTWTITVQPAPAGSLVTVTEHGEVYNALFRVVGRFVLGYHRTADGYLRALARSFGGDAQPAPGQAAEAPEA